MTPTQSLPLLDGPVTFAGAVSLQTSEQGVQPWRLDYRQLALYEPMFRGRGVAVSGVRLTLVSDTSTLLIEADSPLSENCFEAPEWTFDLLVDGKLHQRIAQPVTQGTFQFTDIPAGEHRLEVYLDLARPVRVSQVLIDAGASARRFDDPRPRWMVYGSSITHCRGAHGPSESWPALVARQFDLNLLGMGFGGNCHLEPMVCRTLRDQPADLISTCVGINVQGQGSLNARTFRAAVIGMVLTIRDTHPTQPFVVVSPICSPPRETTGNIAGLTLPDYRKMVRDAVEALRSQGDANLHYVDGLELFGADFAHHMPDQLHPDADGMHVLAQRYAKLVMPHLGLTPSEARA